MKAQYLLRFDDICPTLNWSVWEKVETVLRQERIKPMLAVVPDNQDEALRVWPANDSFWERVREWQARGWTIGMHGWQHRFVTDDGGILALNRVSEFAGLSPGEQQRKLRAGCTIFHEQHIHCDLWIAPAHSFDVNTIKALRELGVSYISDGFSLFPYIDNFGMTWIPQQLWSFRSRPLGVWTICFHCNSWTMHDVKLFEERVRSFRRLISSFWSVVDCYCDRQKTIFDSAAARMYCSASLVKQSVGELAKIRLRRPSSGPSAT
jgi:Uncharacterized protein conserved in bacteria (DUF2334)